ncbi:MAG TPA: thiamine pyrophosphate-dependent enzyme [Polyangiaceae bacterium]|nr:thiamine pyrophosphate-dependent enzyme [Polyangiaceae bacterium]
MSLERIRLLVERFRREILSPPLALVKESELEPQLGLELLESMLLARHLDRAAHELRASGHGHYTICSSGHEGNVVLGRLTTPADPSLIHYRSGALQLERARHAPELDPVLDIALSLVASREEPASGGRHKVFGSRRLGIIPKTSTIASHLPRAVGLAFALERRQRLGIAPTDDAIVLASFGDASINHSTALGALNAAGWVTHQNLRLPVLFVCEDNGLGVSVRTPEGWIAERVKALPHIEPFFARGWDLGETWRAAEAAVAYCRSRRRPALLHLTCRRLLGHAGSDVDTSYRSPAELEEAIQHDPVLCHALSLVKAGHTTGTALLALDQTAAERVDRAAERAKTSPRLRTRGEVMSALVRPFEPRKLVPAQPAQEAKRRPASSETLTLAQGINRALGEILETDPGALVFGEDVAKKGGVYGITKGLFERFGPLRVFNTLLDEQTILGLALGSATLGLLPIAEIQYLAYLHNAEDQLRGEAATFRYFSQGDYENPMIVRIAGLAYQKGFGGHFHNDNSLSVLRDIPGIVVAVPARADDALALYRAARQLTAQAGRVVVIVEPIALYHRRDLSQEGDAAWLAADSGEIAELGRGRMYRAEGRDLLIVSYGNGVALSLAAARTLSEEDGISARVLDLRWVSPLPHADILAQARATGRVLMVDECRHSGNLSEQVAALLLDAGYRSPFARVTGADSFIPLGDAALTVLPSEQEIVSSARALLAQS